MDLERFFKEKKIDVFAIGDVDTIKAPEGFHPKDILPESKSIIVYGREIGEYVFKLGSREKTFYLHELINQMDGISFELCEILGKEGFPSVPIPTFFPSRIKRGKIRGILSLKHFAQAVGLGSMGENTLLISKEYGNRLCLSAVLTEKEYHYKKNPDNEQLCLKCNKCIKVCPTHAIANGSVEPTQCLNFTHSIPKFLRPFILFAIKMKWLEKHIENRVNIIGWNSDMVCSDCLTICPHFRTKNSIHSIKN